MAYHFRNITSRGSRVPFAQLLSSSILLLACVVLLSDCTVMVERLGGAWQRPPSDMPDRLSAGTRKFAEMVYAGTDPERLADYHVHLVGLGENGSGCYVNPRMLSGKHPLHHFRFRIYCSAGGVTDLENGDSQFSDRLLKLAQTAPGRFLLLAFDEHRGASGQVVPEKTEFHVPSSYALKIAGTAPDRLAAVGSVHPLRPDACDELRRLHAKGVRIIKWLPNAMGIDPAAPECDAFYDTMRTLGMVLLTHGGVEAAVDASEAQRLGNPLRLQRALEHGVKVIVAHCASLGKDDETIPSDGKPVENWQLLLRLMEDPRWEGLLFADLSATTQYNRSALFLRTILERNDLHHRFVNGSDYPLPAVNVVIWLRRWVRAGLLDAEDLEPLREIYDVNPLVFDFALKRRLRVVHSDGRVSRFAASVFHEHPALRLSAPDGQH